MKLLRNLMLFGAALLSTAAAQAETRLTWYGHAAFKIETPSGKVVLLDPWIKNPANKNGEIDLAALEKVDLILVTHGHGDHIGDSVEIARKTGAQLVATFDLGKAIVQYQGFPEKQFDRAGTGNFGGEIVLLDGEVKVAFVPAVHSSSISFTSGNDLAPGGNPGGFLVTVKNGPSIYHTGDTDLFSDMRFIKEFHPVDVMLTAIGDKFTMGPTRAAYAAELIQPVKMIVPMHFGTFPVLAGNPADFDRALKARKVKAPMREMKVGETLTL